jgi:UDP-GlcNAc:undecaprenyl-phosphate/decaprenyl-phosphate GlcNAc-1-phosphate transferase
MFPHVLLLFACALALSLAITPAVRIAALRWRLVDWPDQRRKIHSVPVARIGGAAVFLAYLGACVAAAAMSGGGAITSAFAAMRAFAPAALIVFAAGLADDIAGLKPWQKLVAEIVAAILIVASGMSVLHGSTLASHPVVAAVCTVVWLVLCMNAVNLIDGLDGLAAGIALLASVTALCAALFYGNLVLALATAPLIGALIGFLVFNFHPASIFLGDSGSLLIGFLLGCCGILWSRESRGVPGIVAPAIALAVPLTDTTLAILRRFLRAQPIFSADRSHIHHRLLARGFSQPNAALALYGASAVACVGALTLSVAETRWEPLPIAAALACGAVIGIRRLGYAELETAGRVLTHSAFLREVNAQLTVRAFEDRLAAATTSRDRWTAIEEASQQFGLHAIHLHESNPVPGSHWALRIPISPDDWIELEHETGPVNHSSAVVDFAETIERVLSHANEATSTERCIHEYSRD